MNIEIKVSLAGDGFGWSPGDVITVGQDVDKAEAGRWVAAEMAAATDKPRGLRSPPPEHFESVEQAVDPKAGVETAAGRGKRAPRKAASK